MIGTYATPQAFRTALEARLRNLAHAQGSDLQRLRRRVAFERLLARLFVLENPPWLLKGGYALELRLSNRARATVDLDFSVHDLDRLRQLPNAVSAETPHQLIFESLQELAVQDLGDGFQFLIHQPGTELPGAPAGGFRCSVEARLAGRTFARFHLDVGVGDPITAPPEWIEGGRLLDFAGIPPARVALYPLAQQFAEKVHAYTFPWRERENTRVKDLVDLVLLVSSGLLSPVELRPAIQATFLSRQTHQIPASLPMPPSSWALPYLALAEELSLNVPTLTDAYALIEAFWQGHRLGYT